MSRSVGELLDQVTDRLLCPHCGRVGALIGDRRALCQCGRSWYLGPDEVFTEKRGTPIKMDMAAPRDDWVHEGRSMTFVGLCPRCYKEGPLMFDVHQFRDEITGKWENPERIREQVCSPRYLKVVCDCDKGIEE